MNPEMSVFEDPKPTDDMMFICSEDNSLALTGLELRRRQKKGESLEPLATAGRVLHAWDVTDEGGNVVSREYTTTQGYLVSDGEVVTNEQALAEAYVDPRILRPGAIRETVERAREETTLGGLKQKYDPADLEFLSSNAESLAEAAYTLQPSLSVLFIGQWESTPPYLVGRNFEYRIPIKDRERNTYFGDAFLNEFTAFDDVDAARAKLLWEAADPFVRAHIDLYLEGEQVA